MVSTADVEAGVVPEEVVAPAVTGVDVSNIHVEWSEGVVSAEMVPSIVLSIDVVSNVEISAEVVVGTIVDSTADVDADVSPVVPAVVIKSVEVSKFPVELTEYVVSAEVVARVVLSS